MSRSKVNEQQGDGEGFDQALNAHRDMLLRGRSFSGREVLLKNVKKGDFFRRTPDANTTFIKGDYFRDGGFNKYGASDAEDMNREVFLKGNTKVWVDFTY